MPLLSQALPLVFYGALEVAFPGTAIIGLLQSRRMAGLGEFFTVDAGNPDEGKSILWAAPVTFGTPVSRIDGSPFPGGFDHLGDYPVTDQGVTAQYQLWKSNQVGLGVTPFMVTSA